MALRDQREWSLGLWGFCFLDAESSVDICVDLNFLYPNL